MSCAPQTCPMPATTKPNLYFQCPHLESELEGQSGYCSILAQLGGYPPKYSATRLRRWVVYTFASRTSHFMVSNKQFSCPVPLSVSCVPPP